MDTTTGAAEQAEWDARYTDRDQLWSGNPNGALVAEVAGLPPGRVLDVGCGEGADAVWLAHRGWQVTALDVSAVALDRARAAAAQQGVDIRWVRAALTDAALDPGGFDLVTTHYPALRRTPGQDAERALLAAVAPGGVLLAVFHADFDAEAARAHGFDPDDYVGPDQVTAALGDGWQVEVDQERPRHVDGGAGAHHTHDVVIHAHRLP
jgi:SAM-dependent methyltransferase